MKTTTLEEPLYVSGDQVEPGRYRDIETGALVQVELPDELPEGARIVRFARYFRREDDEETDHPPDMRELIHVRADSMTRQIVHAAEALGQAAYRKRALRPKGRKRTTAPEE